MTISFQLTGTTDRVISDQDEKLSRTLKHFKEYIHNKFNRYAFGFFFCELLNLFLAFVGFWITHRFLNDEFLTYGFDSMDPFGHKFHRISEYSHMNIFGLIPKPNP